jgi:hypothetical protein
VKLPASGGRTPSRLASGVKRRPPARATAGRKPVRTAKAGRDGRRLDRKARAGQPKHSVGRDFRGFRYRWFSRHHGRHFYYSSRHRGWFYWSHKKGRYLSTGYMDSDPPDGDNEPEVAGGEPPDLPEGSAVEPPDEDEDEEAPRAVPCPCRRRR